MSETIYRKTQEGDREACFSSTETAKILGMTQGNVSSAVSRGAMNAVEIKGERYKKIPVSKIVSYANRTGRDMKKVTTKIENKTGEGDEQILIWVLAGLDLSYLLETGRRM